MFGWICCTAFYNFGNGQIDRCHIFYFNLHPAQIIGIPRNSPVRKLVICRIHMINTCIIFICPICLWRDSHPPYPSIFVVVQNNTNVTAAFTNQMEQQPVTGIVMMTFPYVLILCIAVLALGYGYARRKRNV